MEPPIHHVVLLTLPVFKGVFYQFLEKHGNDIAYNFVFDYDELKTVTEKNRNAPALLISFGTGVIVPEKILKKFHRAYNFHPAPPEYPGLDPHFFAVFDRVTTYGTTCHIMTEKVDSGPIVAVKRFPVEGSPHAMKLLDMTLNHTFEMINHVFQKILAEGIFPEPIDEKWGQVICTKALKKSLCKVDPLIEEEAFCHLLHSFQTGVGEQKNLYIDLHGHRFRYEGKI